MFKALSISITLLYSSQTFSIVGEETVVLSSILSQQIQAVAGIAQMVKIGKDEVQALEEAYNEVEDAKDRVDRAIYYAQTIGNFGKNYKDVQSFVEIRENLESANNIYQRRSDLTLGYDFLKSSSNHGSKVIKNKTKSNKLDAKEFGRLKKKAQRSGLKQGESSALSARAAVLGLKLQHDNNQNLASLIMQVAAQNDALAVQMAKADFDEYATKLRWGLIPNISYESYLILKRENR